MAAILHTRAWQGLEGILGRMLCEYLATPFDAARAEPAAPEGAWGATVALTEGTHRWAIDLFLFAEPASARAIAASFCVCDEAGVDDETIADVLLELANSGMGAIKAAFLDEGLKLTGALPRRAAPRDATAPASQASACIAAYRSQSAVVHALVGARPLAASIESSRQESP